MNILFFIIILGALIFVHELGHFLMAKRAGIRVDEFALGFPPRLFARKYGETTYILNLIPFGGYVKIFGEDPDTESISGPDAKRSLINKSFGSQALVLLGGILFNIIFAWMLLTVGYMSGIPTLQSDAYPAEKLTNISTVVTAIAPNSPAERAGIEIGDEILELQVNGIALPEISIERFIEELQSPDTQNVGIVYKRGAKTTEKLLTPESGIVEGNQAIGLGFDRIGLLHLPIQNALWEGTKTTGEVLIGTVVGFGQLISDAVKGDASIDSLTGPVGLVPEVGRVVQFGFAALLWFTAFISISLAVINVMPFPALDGGRLLFLAIEKIKGSRIPPKIINTIHTVGFFLLIGLMIAVTYNDILGII